MKDVILIEDSDYGAFKQEFVACVDYDFLRRNIDFNTFTKWNSKYRPSKFFHSASMLKKTSESTEEIESKGFISECFDIYVCIDDINRDWDSTIWANKYGMANKKHKLPVAISRAKVNEWIDEYEKLLKQAAR